MLRLLRRRCAVRDGRNDLAQLLFPARRLRQKRPAGRSVSFVRAVIAVRRPAELLAAEGGDRRAADADKQAADLQLPAVLQADAGQALTAQQLRYDAVPAECHIVLLSSAASPAGAARNVLRRCNERHMAAQPRQQQSLTDGGIAAADHGDVLPAEKRPSQAAQ